MVTKRFLKNVIVAIVSVFMSLVVVQGVQAQQTGLDYQSLNLLPFTGNKQLVLGEFDHLGRATSAHIQLQDKDEPKKKREPRLSYNPVGWHLNPLTGISVSSYLHIAFRAATPE